MSDFPSERPFSQSLKKRKGAGTDEEKKNEERVSAKSKENATRSRGKKKKLEISQKKNKRMKTKVVFTKQGESVIPLLLMIHLGGQERRQKVKKDPGGGSRWKK